MKNYRNGRRKEMPLESYTWTHGEAKLNDAQIEAVVEWAKQVRAKICFSTTTSVINILNFLISLILNKKLLIIGFVWPEPKSSAAGSRMMQLIEVFQSQDYDITFASRLC